MKLQDRLKRIRLLLLDVDGVLTDGSIIYDDQGMETKAFNAKDGLGMRLLMDAGIEIGLITGRSSKALKHRCQNLGISRLMDGVGDKAVALERVMSETGLTRDQIGFVGDDLPDMAIMARVGLRVAVSDAHPAVRDMAHMVTQQPGGRGAVRELCEAILEAKGLLEDILKKMAD